MAKRFSARERWQAEHRAVLPPPAIDRLLQNWKLPLSLHAVMRSLIEAWITEGENSRVFAREAKTITDPLGFEARPLFLLFLNLTTTLYPRLKREWEKKKREMN